MSQRDKEPPGGRRWYRLTVDRVATYSSPSLLFYAIKKNSNEEMYEFIFAVMFLPPHVILKNTLKLKKTTTKNNDTKRN